VAPPPFLSEEGREEWLRIVGDVTRLGLLRDIDIGAFTARNIAYEMMVRSYALAKSEGFFYVHEGVKRAHPGVKLTLQAMAALNAFNERFGLDPQSRARVAHVTGEQAVQPSLPGTENLPEQRDPSRALPSVQPQKFDWHGPPH
jgi:P27 family predicted phage terminase small subunit